MGKKKVDYAFVGDIVGSVVGISEAEASKFRVAAAKEKGGTLLVCIWLHCFSFWIGHDLLRKGQSEE